MLQYTRVIKLFVFFSFSVLLTSCAGDALTAAIKKAASDNVISQAECDEIKDIILSDKSAYKNLHANGEVKSKALANRIRAVVKKSSIQIECDKEEEATDAPKAKYEVYLENSRSMDGYVNGSTDFKNTLHSYLTNIELKTNNLTDNMKLFYINSEKIPFKNDLKDFILNLSPVSFQKHGGDGKSTDFSIMFDTLLKSCADDKVVIFISDCVLAPKQGGNAEVFLDLHKHALKKTFNDHLSDHKDFKTIVLKLNSEFSGTYYDFKVGTHQLKKGNRPYYMWILGNKQHVDQLIAKIGVPKDAENYLVFSCAEKSPTHKVLFTQKIGEYTKGDSNNTLIKASKAEVGKNAGYFGFPVGIDLTEYVFDSSHLLSPESYKVMPPSYSVTVEPVTDDEKDNKPYLKNFSHCLVLRTTDLQEEEISIQLKRALPGWVSQSNSEDDTRQAGGEQHKTYGILHMLTGIAEAYESAAKDKEAYFKLTFAIEK